MLVATKTVVMDNVMAKRQETMSEQIPKVAQHKVIRQDQHKTKTCQKLRVIKQCHNLHCLFHQALIATSQTAKMRDVPVKAVGMLVEQMQTRIARTELAAEVVKSSCHIN